MSSCSSIKSNHQPSLEYLKHTPSQYYQDSNLHIEYAPKSDTIFLFGGLTTIQDRVIESALQSLNINAISLENATFRAYELGKIYGNKAQCNPTYFTVGNLIKYLLYLRDEQKIPTKEIIKKYAYITAGGCGPCRFGMYVTEYKKALRDAGFDGFRVTSFEHDKGIFQGEDREDTLIEYSPKFFITLIKAVIIGDLLNIKAHKIRPYEIDSGETNRALEHSTQIISEAFKNHSSLLLALYKCRKIFQKVEIDSKIKKPKVLITGEFWASLTDGDGNYNLHKFLEEQGAEVIPQPVLNRLMLSIWESSYNNSLKKDIYRGKNIDISYTKERILLAMAKYSIKTFVSLYSKALYLKDFKLVDVEKLASLAKDYYPLECSGGEGHMEVAHLLENIKYNIANLVISVKPFGCMPSSAVSDGIQSLIVSKYPEANFLSIETSGEGATNFYSRVQMALFKAKEQFNEK